MRNAIEGSTYEGTFGALLDKLMAQKRLYENKTDTVVPRVSRCHTVPVTRDTIPVSHGYGFLR